MRLGTGEVGAQTLPQWTMRGPLLSSTVHVAGLTPCPVGVAAARAVPVLWGKYWHPTLAPLAPFAPFSIAFAAFAPEAAAPEAASSAAAPTWASSITTRRRRRSLLATPLVNLSHSHGEQRDAAALPLAFPSVWGFHLPKP